MCFKSRSFKHNIFFMLWPICFTLCYSCFGVTSYLCLLMLRDQQLLLVQIYGFIKHRLLVVLHKTIKKKPLFRLFWIPQRVSLMFSMRCLCNMLCLSMNVFVLRHIMVWLNFFMHLFPVYLTWRTFNITHQLTFKRRRRSTIVKLRKY